MTPLTYVQAASLLGVAKITISQAASRGVLTKIPTGGNLQKVSREQVELFKGKKRLSLNSLSPEEMKLWEKYRDEATAPSSEAIPLPEDAMVGLAFLERLGQFTRSLSDVQREVPQGSPFSISTK